MYAQKSLNPVENQLPKSETITKSFPTKQCASSATFFNVDGVKAQGLSSKHFLNICKYVTMMHTISFKNIQTNTTASKTNIKYMLHVIQKGQMKCIQIQ